MDWPEELKELKDIDNALRCPICYEYMEGAMFLPACSHNYCSLCIRRYIQYKSQCPTCNAVTSEPELKNNRALDHLVASFSAVRSKLLSLAKNVLVAEPNHNISLSQETMKTQAPVVKNNPLTSAIAKQSRLSSKLSQKRSQNEPDVHIVRKKRLTGRRPIIESDSDSDEVIICDEIDAPPTPKLTSDERDDPTFIPQMKKRFIAAPISDKPSINAFTILGKKPLLNSISVNRVIATATQGSSSSTVSRAASTPTPSSSQISSNAQPSDQGPEIKRVDCPVCSVSVPERNINLHLDRCLSGGEKKESLRKKRKPMTKLVYALMSDKDIRKKLTDLGLPKDGDRQVLIKRHNEFTLLYNAECDATNPKSAQEIIQDMSRREKTQNRLASAESSKGKLSLSKGASSDDIEQAQKAYVKQHQNHFAALIAETKARMKKKKEEAMRKPPADAVIKQPSPSQGASSTAKESDNNPTSGASDLWSMDLTDDSISPSTSPVFSKKASTMSHHIRTHQISDSSSSDICFQNVPEQSLPSPECSVTKFPSLASEHEESVTLSHPSASTSMEAIDATNVSKADDDASTKASPTRTLVTPCSGLEDSKTQEDMMQNRTDSSGFIGGPPDYKFTKLKDSSGFTDGPPDYKFTKLKDNATNATDDDFPQALVASGRSDSTSMDAFPNGQVVQLEQVEERSLSPSLLGEPGFLNGDDVSSVSHGILKDLADDGGKVTPLHGLMKDSDCGSSLSGSDSKGAKLSPERGVTPASEVPSSYDNPDFDLFAAFDDEIVQKVQENAVTDDAELETEDSAMVGDAGSSQYSDFSDVIPSSQIRSPPAGQVSKGVNEDDDDFKPMENRRSRSAKKRGAQAVGTRSSKRLRKQ